MFRHTIRTCFKINKYSGGRSNLYLQDVISKYFCSESVLDFPNNQKFVPKTSITNHTFQKSRSVLKGETSHIISEMKSLKHVDEVLQYLRTHSKLDITEHVYLCRILFNLLRSKQTSLSNEEFIQTHEFENFCRNIKKNVRFLNAFQILSVLKLLSFLNVSMNSILSQHLLQMLTKLVNQLHLRQITFLSLLLSNAAPSALVDALKIALPIVFDANVRLKLEYENPVAVVEGLSYACRNSVSYESLGILTNAALKISHRFNAKLSFQTIISLSCVKRKLSSDEKLLFEKCLENLHGKLFDNFSFSDVVFLVSVIIEKYIFDDTCFYDYKIILESCEYVISKKLQISEIGQLLRNFNRVSYANRNLLNYIDECFDNLSNFDSLSSESIIYFVSSCCNDTFKPERWSNYESEIIKFIVNRKSENISLHRILLDLIVLDCWPSSLIEITFSDEYITKKFFESKINNLEYIGFLNLYQILETLGSNKNLSVVSPPKDIIEKAINLNCNRTIDLSVAHCLFNGFGGKEYVLNGVRSAIGFYIDHLLVKCKDGSMLPINKNGCEEKCDIMWENLNLPSNCQPIGIILLSPASYCIEGIKLRGRIKIILNAMESLGINIIPIAVALWDNLPNNERIPYLTEFVDSVIPDSAIPDSNWNEKIKNQTR